MHKAGIQDIRLYAAVNNDFTITGYKGYNPEVDYNYSVNGSFDPVKMYQNMGY
ncbi:hypothetical protein ACQ86N_05340 [Puia sp. P3]|uniref:hypothetical protein n=1 Tax=Puia sp. P3 TaxID=3423952 RepID=UPI003D66525E